MLISNTKRIILKVHSPKIISFSPSAFPLGIVVTTSQDTLKSLRPQINHYTHEGQPGQRQPLLAANWRYLDGMLLPLTWCSVLGRYCNFVCEIHTALPTSSFTRFSPGCQAGSSLWEVWRKMDFRLDHLPIYVASQRNSLTSMLFLSQGLYTKEVENTVVFSLYWCCSPLLTTGHHR